MSAPLKPLAAQYGWDAAILWFARILFAHGSPSQLAAKRKIFRVVALQIRHILRPLERFVAQLVLIEAFALPETKFSPQPWSTTEAAANFGRPGYGCEDSAMWGTLYRLPCTRKPKRRILPSYGGVKSYKPTPVLISPWPIAERLEALFRVLANPLPYAKRVRASMVRNLKPHVEIRRRMRAQFRLFSVLDALYQHDPLWDRAMAYRKALRDEDTS